MAALRKSRNPSRLPLALNPTKSKDVLAVLAERNPTVAPVGAWVEPASPEYPEISARTSACMIEEELKEQQRRKQESLKHFQRQVKHRVNQQIRLRKKQQLQKSYKAAEKEGSIVMQCSDSAHLTPKRTSVFQSNLNAAIGSSSLPLSWMLGDSTEGGENQNELFQQAQALSQTMKQARHQLASFKTTSEKKAPVFLNDRRKSSPTQEKALSRKPPYIKMNKETREEIPFKIHEGPLTTVHYQNFMENQELGFEEMSFVMTDEKEKEPVFGMYKQDLLSKDKNKPFNRVQKVKFKNPLFVVIKEDEQKQLNLQGHQNILPEAQNYLPKAQGDLPQTQDDVIEVQSLEPEASSVEPDTQSVKLEIHSVEPEGQAETQNILLTTHTIELDGILDVEAQPFLPKCQDQDSSPQNHFVLKYRKNLPNHQDHNVLSVDQELLSRNQHFLSKEQNILKCQDQGFLPEDQNFLPEDQCALPPNQYILHKHQGQDFISEDEDFLLRDQHVLPNGQHILPKDQNNRLSCQDPDLLPPNQSLYVKQKLSDRTIERCQEDLRLDGHQHRRPPSHQRDTCSRRQQVYDKCHSGLSTEFQAPLAFQSGVDQEEDKKERQKQYLRHRRLFMDIEREQVKEQQRQKEQKKKIEKIKKKKEQQRYAEEQRILRTNSHEVPYTGEMSDILAQLQLEEIKGAREKQQQKEKEYVRYVEALRAQVQEKMKLYNITLPPLCCCGPDFWDAHPDTCANNCIFYKNYRAYNRALQSVINSADISEGITTLRNAIRNFACAHKRTSKKVCNKNLKSTETTGSISAFT